MFISSLLQEVLLWIKKVVEECGENITTEQLKDYVWKTLNSGKVNKLFICHCLGYVKNEENSWQLGVLLINYNLLHKYNSAICVFGFLFRQYL